ncbi:hypothetical protein BGZ63DRAFT_412215 [Mariannaea sp. PMI_226]|nr:hypothetical protein BGZ63DRAFT_412215 [Mariannaea sp. PMI_226]
MPLINGQKMACEPCIRGHRSTKCTHANERLMVPVRKPGRPLSTCPHPASRPCSCTQVTAAIPRKQKCHCGTKSAESAKVKNENGESSKLPMPQSPSKSTTPSYRIQKTNHKTSTPNSNRKQSVDPTTIERMDPNMFNVINSYNGAQPPTAAMPDVSAFGGMGMMPADLPFGNVMYPMFPPQMTPHMMSSANTNGVHSGHTTPSSTQAQEQIDTPALKIGSCCGGGERNGSVTTTSISRSSTAASSPADGSKTKSCCSPGIISPKANKETDNLPTPNIPTTNGFIMPFQAPMLMPNGMYGYYPQPTVFTYPPQYGSYLQPLQPEQWRQIMTSMTFPTQGMMPSPYGVSTSGAVPYQPQTVPHPTPGTSHQCSCGASCQCVGCAAHPYNEATQNYVRSAWQSMMDDAQHHTHVNDLGMNEATTQRESSDPPATPVVAPVEGTISPAAPQTPSEAASGMSEEQTLSASDFFFVNYPFGDSCAGDTASCPCGDDCQCLGCVIHGNQDPVTANRIQAS